MLSSHFVDALWTPTQTADINVRWNSGDVPQGRGTEGQNDVATIFAQAIGQNFPGVMEVFDIGVSGDNQITIQMVHDGPIDTDNPGNGGINILQEFDSSFYNVTATLPNVTSNHGNSGEYDGGKAPGSFHTNGTPARDSEKIFDTVVVPEFTSEYAGLVPAATDQPDSESFLTPGGWQERNWIDRAVPRDVVQQVDALGKPRTTGLYWNTDGTLNRVIKDVRIGNALTDGTFTVGLFWTSGRLSSVEYHFGAHTGTGAFNEADRVATKTLHYNAAGQLTGTTIAA